MAERAVDRIAKKLTEDYQINTKPCTTDTIPLCGNEFKKFKQVKKYIAQILDRIKADGFTQYDAWFLVTNYGKQTEIILEYYKNRQEKDNPTKLILAELQFGITYEMVQDPMDFFIRRTGRLYFDIDSVRYFIDPVLKEFEIVYNTDTAKILDWKKALLAQLKEHSDFSMERV